MHANGLIVDYVRRNDLRRFVRLGDRCGDVLVSLPHEDWLREASSCFDIYYMHLADVHVQN